MIPHMTTMLGPITATAIPKLPASTSGSFSNVAALTPPTPSCSPFLNSGAMPLLALPPAMALPFSMPSQMLTKPFSVAMPMGSALTPKTQLVLAALELLAKNQDLVKLVEAQSKGHSCDGCCAVCALLDVSNRMNSAGHSHLQGLSRSVTSLTSAADAAQYLEHLLAEIDRICLLSTQSSQKSVIFSYQEVAVDQKPFIQAPPALLLQADVSLSGIEVAKLGGCGLSIKDESGCAHSYRVKAAMMRKWMPSQHGGSWHYYVARCQDHVWRTCNGDHAMLLLGFAQVLMLERVDPEPLVFAPVQKMVSPTARVFAPQWTIPEETESMEDAPVDPVFPVRHFGAHLLQPELKLPHNFHLSPSPTPSVSNFGSKYMPTIDKSISSSPTPPPAFFSVGGHQVEVKGLRNGYMVELEWMVEHEPIPHCGVQCTVDLTSLAQMEGLKVQMQDILRQLGLGSHGANAAPWIDLDSTATSELFAMLKGWTAVQRDGQVTRTTDGKVAQVINLSRSRKTVQSRNTRMADEMGTMAVRFTLLPSSNGEAYAAMTCLYRRGNLERPFGSQPRVPVDPMALFGRLPMPADALPQRATGAVSTKVIIKGVDRAYDVVELLQEKLGFTVESLFKKRALRKRGCRQGMRTVQMATGGQVEFLADCLGHLFVGFGQGGRKQPRFLKFERDRRHQHQGARKFK